MKTLNRNKTSYHYRNYINSTPITDADGYDTGETKQNFGSIKQGKAYITPSQGNVHDSMFGADLNYEKVMLMDECPFNEYSQLWIDAETTKSFDYKVVKIAKSLNSYSVAIAKVIRND